MLDILFGLFGLASLLGIAWAFSDNKRKVDWKLVGTGVLLQLGFASIVLLTPWGAKVFDALAHGFVKLSAFTAEGSKLIFGDLVDMNKFGFIFAFQVLPTIIFFAAFMAVLYHIGVMQYIVRGMTWAITKVMRVSGAETTSVCASVFIGQTEAPLTVRPYIDRMTNSELLTMMIGGMAHIAGGVMATYILMLGGSDPEAQAIFAKHFLAASIMAAPATLIIAKILIPETGEPLTRGSVKVHVEKTTANIIDAAASGAADGLKLALNIAAMLLAFTALIALLNAIIAWGGDAAGLTAWINAGRETPFAFNLGSLLGVVLSPIAWLIGVPWEDAIIAGGLIGQKIVLNEFIAYGQLADVPVGDGVGAISMQTKLILTYALCGFANFSSIAIQIGGIGGLAPGRRPDLARFGLRAVLGGSIATFMTATIAGVLTKFV
ncbi:MAG: NupC/NupG family nucleoside CNT transporter [Aquimonas sp.]|nr:NupC/NupG family nucleoside CNT transporter [Aquimonas sp.]